ncbi:unnamed protein product [Ixodes persulcatus]
MRGNPHFLETTRISCDKPLLWKWGQITLSEKVVGHKTPLRESCGNNLNSALNHRLLNRSKSRHQNRPSMGRLAYAVISVDFVTGIFV